MKQFTLGNENLDWRIYRAGKKLGKVDPLAVISKGLSTPALRIAITVVM